jgi:hypothetical protein
MDFMTGVAWGNKWRAEGAEEGMAKATEAVNMALGIIERQKLRIAELERKALISDADAQARLAQVEAMKAQHPDSPLLQATAERFQGTANRGKAKTKLRLIYEANFDRIVTSLGLLNAPSIRNDVPPVSHPAVKR